MTIAKNYNLLIRTLLSSGLKGLDFNKYSLVDATMCDIRNGQFGTSYRFNSQKCISRRCEECGKEKLWEVINHENSNLLKSNKKLSWHRWQAVEGKSAPQKVQVKGTLRGAVNELLDVLENLAQHLFCANWHKIVFEYIKKKHADWVSPSSNGLCTEF